MYGPVSDTRPAAETPTFDGGLGQTMRILWLIHWEIAEAEERAPLLRALGYDVKCASPRGYPELRPLRCGPPNVVVIDLSRRPSYGRDVARGLRTYKGTRSVPLVFLDGKPDKMKPIRELLPDATYADWSGVADALANAIDRAPASPVVPPPPMEGYSGVPLTRKLGLKPAYTVALIDAPRGFEETLRPLPKGLALVRGASDPCDVALWFVTSHAELERRIGQIGTYAGDRALWIIWPKKASGVSGDLSQRLVREAGLAAGLVDFKVCSVDETWSGLLFTRRKRPRRQTSA